MKIPEYIKIGAHNVKVVYPYHFKENPDLCGQADYCLGEIRISDKELSGENRTDTSIQITLLHEIIHWVLHVYHGEENLTEHQVCSLSQGLTQVLNDNNLFKE